MDLTTLTVGEIAARLPSATRVFKKYSIDFCCGGGHRLSDLMDRYPGLLKELSALFSNDSVQSPEFANDCELIDFILERYHQQHRLDFPELIRLAAQVEMRHRDHQLAPIGLTKHLEEFFAELGDHMEKEEMVLFPIIKRDPQARPTMPIMVMMDEHVRHGAQLQRIEQLTHDFQIPDSACPTWQGLYTGLRQLIDDIHEHVHLENNVLFQRTLDRA